MEEVDSGDAGGVVDEEGVDEVGLDADGVDTGGVDSGVDGNGGAAIGVESGDGVKREPEVVRVGVKREFDVGRSDEPFGGTGDEAVDEPVDDAVDAAADGNGAARVGGIDQGDIVCGPGAIPSAARCSPGERRTSSRGGGSTSASRRIHQKPAPNKAITMQSTICPASVS